jgi:hypothetical protein
LCEREREYIRQNCEWYSAAQGDRVVRRARDEQEKKTCKTGEEVGEGEARQGRQGKARQGKAKQGKARQKQGKSKKRQCVPSSRERGGERKPTTQPIEPRGLRSKVEKRSERWAG